MESRASNQWAMQGTAVTGDLRRTSSSGEDDEQGRGLRRDAPDLLLRAKLPPPALGGPQTLVALTRARARARRERERPDMVVSGEARSRGRLPLELRQVRVVLVLHGRLRRIRPSRVSHCRTREAHEASRHRGVGVGAGECTKSRVRREAVLFPFTLTPSQKWTGCAS